MIKEVISCLECKYFDENTDICRRADIVIPKDIQARKMCLDRNDLVDDNDTWKYEELFP